MDGINDAAFFRTLVEAGGISAAAGILDSSPPSVSRRLAALEQRLGIRLAERSTRRFALTSEGELYYARSAELLALLRDIEAEVSARGAVARGRLRLGAPMDLGRRHVAPLLARFARDHPGLEAHLILSDSGLELGQDGLDVALRIGPPHESGVISRKLVECPTFICAAPAYAAQRGLPKSLDELVGHACLRLARKHRLIDVWRFRTGEGLRDVAVGGQLASESGDVLRQWAIDGHGLSREALWDVTDDLRDGRLVQCLHDTPCEPIALHLAFLPGRPPPPRIRLLVDFLITAFQLLAARTLETS